MTAEALTRNHESSRLREFQLSFGLHGDGPDEAEQFTADRRHHLVLFFPRLFFPRPVSFL